MDALAIQETVRTSIAPAAPTRDWRFQEAGPCKPQHGFTHLYNHRGKRMVGEAGGSETGQAPLPKTQRP